MTEFERLFLENRDFIFKYLMKLTQDLALAEELTQETFFRAYMNFTALREKEKASAWLCRIAQNTYFAWLREQKKTVPFEHAEALPAPDDVEQTCERRELSQKALLCLHELNEPYKEVFMLSVFGGFPLKEISALFGKSESWARVTFYRAKQKLSERMREQYGL